MAVRTLALALSLSLLALPPPHTARADSAIDGELDAVCGKTLSQADQIQSGANAANPALGSQQQKLQYCQAAKTAQEGSHANSAMWKVWSAVGVVCTYGCVASFAGGPTSEYICMGATVAGGVTDALVTKNFTSAIMAVGGVGAGFMINQQMNKGNDQTNEAKEAKEGAKEGEKATKETKEVKKDKDIGACINAAMAGLQVFMKYRSMKNDDDSMQTNLDSAKKVADSNVLANNGAANGYNPQGQAANGSGGGTGGDTGNPSNPSDPNLATTRQATCASARNNPTGGTILQCAIASDSTLPGFVSSPKFNSEFKKDSGQNLGDYLTKDGPPGPMMAGASTNGMNAAQAGKLATAISDLESQVADMSMPSSTYGHNGGGGSEGGGADNSMGDMQQMLAGMMEQLNPNAKKGTAPKTGVNAVIFANKTRGPASVAEDKTLNIFDRVTYRYYFVGRRMTQDSTPQ
ncbi:hypothetical protein WDW37_02360 [Bdellovibrionota bacterium FG-1]